MTLTHFLPNLVIVGVPKAGTTSLFNYLAQHPDVCASRVKELDYFTPLRQQQPLPPIEQYAANFAHRRSERVVLEASPSYSFSGAPVIQALQESLPDARIILCLRDPVARLWSAYTFKRSRGQLLDVGSFEEFLDRCQRERERGADMALGNRYVALSVGFYSHYVPLWLDAFKEALHVVFFEQMAAQTSQTVEMICRWLEIDEAASRSFDYTVVNRTRQARSERAGRLVRTAASRLGISKDSSLRRAAGHFYGFVNTRPVSERLDGATRTLLQSLYAPSNHATAEALEGHGYADLPPWLRSGSA